MALSIQEIRARLGEGNRVKAPVVINRAIRKWIPGGNDLLDAMEATHELCKSFFGKPPDTYRHALHLLKCAKQEMASHIMDERDILLMPKNPTRQTEMAVFAAYPGYNLVESVEKDLRIVAKKQHVEKQCIEDARKQKS